MPDACPYNFILHVRPRKQIRFNLWIYDSNPLQDYNLLLYDIVEAVKFLDIFPADGNEPVGITHINFSVGEFVDFFQRDDKRPVDTLEFIGRQHGFHFFHRNLRQDHGHAAAENFHIIVHGFDKHDFVGVDYHILIFHF